MSRGEGCYRIRGKIRLRTRAIDARSLENFENANLVKGVAHLINRARSYIERARSMASDDVSGDRITSTLIGRDGKLNKEKGKVQLIIEESKIFGRKKLVNFVI